MSTVSLHRFTTAVRAGLTYAGTELITLGGGEAMWLYINETLMFEYITNGSSSISCFVLDLSTATQNGKILPFRKNMIILPTEKIANSC